MNTLHPDPGACLGGACPACLLRAEAEETPKPLDWTDLPGHESVKRAVEVALVGPHPMLLIATPGYGATRFTDLVGVRIVPPCPCGQLGNPRRACTCEVPEIAAHQRAWRADTYDLVVEAPPMTVREMFEEGVRRESFAVAKARALAARERVVGPPDAPSIALLRAAACQLGITWEVLARIRAVATSIAALDHAAHVEAQHMAEAIQYAPRPTTEGR